VTKGDAKVEVKPDAKTDAKNDNKTPAKPDAAAKIDPKAADPIGELAKTKMAPAKPDEPSAAGKDPFVYFVQAGAYRTTEEAESQRAKLGMMGLDAKINERDQGGRSVFRVRVGPIQTRDEADRVRAKLDEAHLDSVLVRMQR
jgi:cell division protein FtsN